MPDVSVVRADLLMESEGASIDGLSIAIHYRDGELEPYFTLNATCDAFFGSALNRGIPISL